MAKAVRIHSYGAPEEMKWEEVELRSLEHGEALVRIEAAAVNFLDVQMRRGDLVNHKFYKEKGGMTTELPLTIGSQAAGVIEGLAQGCPEGMKVGDRVMCFGGTGTYATHVITASTRLMPIPAGLGVEQAAAVLTQGFLAYAFTHHAYPVRACDWCLVQAAGGGLGMLLVQMAKLCGGRVIGVVSSEKKARAVREVGCDHVIVLSEHSGGSTAAAKEIRRLTGDEGVRVVYDGVGKDVFEMNLDSLGLGGYLIIFGQSSGFIPPLDLMRLQEKGSLFVTRTNGLPYRKHWKAYEQLLLEWLDQDLLKVPIEGVYPMAEAAEVHRRFEQREAVGRMILVP
ncbi:quinone oxidoreductase [Paenibacillus sp. D2_2]|uniref:quinone oxidoreductase family protein n=1 Tax=Paenibacillus sp. D2_2 TaxID=3073092 RepID=UPI00281530F8|nr:quinone oxidoreductase [Paenibacillus sp. D2_2]WMT38874.1 quinone oxidoreductase [Paenibacillus sp. D2_2]